MCIKWFCTKTRRLLINSFDRHCYVSQTYLFDILQNKISHISSHLIDAIKWCEYQSIRLSCDIVTRLVFSDTLETFFNFLYNKLTQKSKNSPWFPKYRIKPNNITISNDNLIDWYLHHLTVPIHSKQTCKILFNKIQNRYVWETCKYQSTDFEPNVRR